MLPYIRLLHQPLPPVHLLFLFFNHRLLKLKCIVKPDHILIILQTRQRGRSEQPLLLTPLAL